MFVWALIPIYRLCRVFLVEPRKLCEKVIQSALNTSQAARAREAVQKARDWSVIVLGALFVVAGSIADAVNTIDGA